MCDSIPFDGGLTCHFGVKNLEASLAWYRDVLGLKLLYHMEEQGWCELESPVDKVNIGLSEVENPDPRGGATLTFGVKNIEVARAALEKHSVKFDGPIQEFEGMVKLSTFYDPDGNKLMFYQSLKEHV